MGDEVRRTTPGSRRSGRPAKRETANGAAPLETLDDASSVSRTRLTLTVKHALSILWAFNHETPTWGVNELGRHLGLNKSMVSRLLATLEERRLVEQDPETEKFRLGVGVLELAGVLLSQLDLRRAAAGPMRELAAATRETVNLAILDGDRVVLIDQVPSPDPVRYVGWIGEREPLYCASPGKVFLAFGDPNLLQVVVAAGLDAHTATTITDPEALRHDLAETRRRGFAINLAEYVESANGIAAPIWRYPRVLSGTVSVAGPAYRLSPDRIAQLGRLVRATAAEISRALGALPKDGELGA
jgi:DNA-binding IclR family transcriptional regulator